MTDYTPSTDEVRSLSAWPTREEVRARFGRAADRIAFDRLLAEVERAAAEKALQEAAADWHEENTGTSPRMYLWLQRRAEQYRKEEK